MRKVVRSIPMLDGSAKGSMNTENVGDNFHKGC